MRITVAVSGGTDSLFALCKLREQGHEVTALHARFFTPPPGEVDPVPGLAALCERWGIPLRVMDLAADFERLVIRPFAEEHGRARTPNPCAVCNRNIKFGVLLDAAVQSHGTEKGPGEAGDALATGHYVAMVEHPIYGRMLHTGADKTKDQSYFLALTPVERLRRCVFPLAGEHKAGIRTWLAERGESPPLPVESQEICFVPHDDHRAFLAGLGTPLPGPGPVVLATSLGTPERLEFEPTPGLFPGERIIARHKGLWQYTEGQRKGLGIAWTEPLFVLRRDRVRNALIVGPQSMLGVDECRADSVNLMADPALWPRDLLVRTRYRQEPTQAEVLFRDNTLHIHFATPQPPPAPGQVAAVYDADGFVLAGGVLNDNDGST